MKRRRNPHTAEEESKLVSFLKEESAQDIFEYVLIIGAVTLAIMVAAAITVPGLFSAVASGVCDAVNGAGNMFCSIS